MTAIGMSTPPLLKTNNTENTARISEPIQASHNQRVVNPPSQAAAAITMMTP